MNFDRTVILVAYEHIRASSTPIEVPLHYLNIAFDAVQPDLLDNTILIRADAKTVPPVLPRWLKIKDL